MDNKITNFSIDHILGRGVDHSSPTAVGPLNDFGYLPDSQLQGPPIDFTACWDFSRVTPRSPGTFNVGLLDGHHRVGVGYGYFGYTPYNYQLSDHFYPRPTVYGFNEETGPLPFLSYLGQPSVGTQHRQRSRMRTIFSECQTKQLEQLFEETDYPSVDARAELSRNTGLTEETVRVWFKNRRARHKRHRRGPKVKSPTAGLRRETEAQAPNTHIQHGRHENVFSSFL